MSTMHQANRGYWNEAAEWWERLEEEGGLWKRCPLAGMVAPTRGQYGKCASSVLASRMVRTGLCDRVTRDAGHGARNPFAPPPPTAGHP